MNTTTTTQPSPQNGISIFVPNWGILLMVIFVAQIFGIVLQKFLFGSSTDKKQLANLAATAIENAQTFVPALRTTELDDYLAKMLRAYAETNATLKESLQENSFEAALEVLKQNPEFIAQLIAARPSQAATMVLRAVRASTKDEPNN